MKILLDNQSIYFFQADPALFFKKIQAVTAEAQFCLRWPSLFVYLGQDSLLSSLPPFELGTPLFEATVAALEGGVEKEDCLAIYDRLFAECLYQIKALPQMKASFFLQAIQQKRREGDVFHEWKQNLKTALDPFEKAFQEKPADTLHDLILYLAWDRMCVWMANLFQFPSTQSGFSAGIQIFKECLIESYQHITQQGKTKPGIYRMLEALFYFQMREEHLQKPTFAEWTLLSQSFPALQSADSWSDSFFIDDAWILEGSVEGKETSLFYLTAKEPQIVEKRLELAQYFSCQLKKEFPDWKYILEFKKPLSLDI